MSASQSKRKRVSSAASTGGAGTLFEQHVDAAFLSLLLVRGIPPVFPGSTVIEVHIQTERMEWDTDDVLLVCEDGTGKQQRLIGQVKRTFTVSSVDEDCKGTITDFWRDFRGRSDFSLANDRFAIITQRGTNTFLGQLGGLLECARHSRDAADFEQRLQAPGFLSSKSKKYCDEIKKIVKEHEGQSVSTDDLWTFLKLIYPVSFDLQTGTAQTEAQCKSLLALTTNESDPIGTATTTWASLVVEAGQGMANGKSYGRDDLPKELLDRHSPVGSPHHTALRRLEEHSTVVLRRIRTVLGVGFHLHRDQLVQTLLQKLETDQVVIVAGPAGSGKSGIAKDTLDALDDCLTFCFRAEEFAAAHLDEVLHRSQIDINGATLGALLAGQDRKVLLVESVERLLEASTREAFIDLLTLARDDRSWQLILTCRDYSTDLVRSSMLQFVGIGHSVMEAPALSDNELDEVASALPALARPLSSSTLRTLLRNPYVLDKASQMEWPEERPLPDSEKEFRAKFWSEVIRADDKPANNMPRRRQDTLVEISLRRARALSEFAPCQDLDAEAIHTLLHESLVTFSPTSDVLIAPAHDVLEDWTILRWIEEQYQINELSLRALADVLGTHPAIRRTYRKWVFELVEHAPEKADNIFESVVVDASLSAQFRDDTLVSLLRSTSASDLLERHASKLFRDDRQLLRQVIHLLRVGCVTTPPWFGGGGAVSSLMHMPDGVAWESALRLVAANLSALDRSDMLIFLGLIEDASRGVSWQSPYPAGSNEVSQIAHFLLPHFDGYRTDEQRKRILQVIAKLPLCDSERVSALLIGDPEVEGRNRLRDEFRELILWGLEGMPIARDLPDVLIAALSDELLMTEEELRREGRYGFSHEIEPLFGLKSSSDYHSFPASAFHGPYLQLLRCHPDKAIQFLLNLLNHSAEWYSARRSPMEFVEPPYEITLRFSDGSTKVQWCNSRLWNLYRGTTVGPYVLQSALMALEQWLLAFGESSPNELDELLISILSRSDSAALTAVVAAAATAHPRLCPETILVLLSSRDCIQLDRARFGAELQAAGLVGMMPLLGDPLKLVYDNERKQANALPHRKHDLETAIANVQLGPHCSRVHDLIDQHRSSVPPVEEQSEDDRVWRLALHRMDLRQYTVATPYKDEDTLKEENDRGDETERKMIRFDLGEADPDVEEMVERSTKEYTAMNARIGLLMWGMKVFARESSETFDPTEWRERLKAARECASDSSDGGRELGEGGPAYVAAVCIRDHFDELSKEEATWCIDTVCGAVEESADNWSDMARVQRYQMAGDRPSVWVLPGLTGKGIDNGLRERVLVAMAYAVLHPVNEVRAYAAYGVGHYLWSSDRGLALRCINALAREAQLVQERWSEEKSRPFQERAEHGQIEYEVAREVLETFFDDYEEGVYEHLDVGEWHGADANCRILSILCRAPEEQLAIDSFERLSHTLVAWWDSDDERRGQQRRRERSSDSEIALTSLVEEFVLKVSTEDAETILRPLIDAMDRHPREVSQILQGVIGTEDCLQQTERFWSIWKLFAKKVQNADWLEHLDDEHPHGGEIIDTVFLTRYWKDNVKHWRSLEGYAHNVHELFETLPPSTRILDDYVRFLYHIGQESLPRAFIRIARYLGTFGQGKNVTSNTVFSLETLLRGFVYGHPMELKREKELREAVLHLLDSLVELGSSAAYRMRDDFVTPAAS
ncbi:MAG: hypothetical protein JXM70_13195 [Pirellulales bacterium]|nr:hypothetical protein [Pirellulales bacterium]